MISTNLSETLYEKIKNFILKNVIMIAIVLVSITYLVTGFITITDTGKALIEIIGESVIVFLFSWFIIQSFSLQGILHGENSHELISAREEFNSVKNNVKGRTSQLSLWIKKKNEITETEIKDEALSDFGLSYNDVKSNNFDKARFTRKELRAIKRVVSRKFTKLSPSELLNYNSKHNNPFYLGKTRSTYLTRRSMSTLTTKLIFTLLFGYFSTTFIGFNIEEFIWKLIQVVLFTVFGIMEYYRSYMFMTVEYSEMLKRKASLLSEFLIDTDETNVIRKGEDYD